MTEQQPYEVLERFPQFELRRYPSHAAAEVSVHGSFGSAGNQTFRALFRYVTGHNESQGPSPWQLRDLARALGLVRKCKGELRPTRRGAAVEKDHESLTELTAHSLPHDRLYGTPLDWW